MSLVSMIGPRPNLLGHQAGTHKRLEVHQPVLTNADVQKIRSIEELVDGAFRTATIDCTWPAAEGAKGLANALQRICMDATDAVLADDNILILSDRAVAPDRIPVPAALATAAVHHHLIRQGLRMQTGLVVETGEAREVHHFCVLAGYGAEAINPYLAFETLEQIRGASRSDAFALRSAEELHQGDRQGRAEGDVQDGHLDLSVLLRSADFRCGRVVLRSGREVFHRHGDQIEGIGLRISPKNASSAMPPPMATIRSIATCWMSAAIMPFRLRGEEHAWTPELVSRLAARGARQQLGRYQPSPTPSTSRRAAFGCAA